MIIDEINFSGQNISSFLEHFGIKGMQWGKRIAVQQQTNLDRVSRVANGTVIKQNRKRILAKRIGAASLLLGATTTALILKHNSHVQIKNLRDEKAILEAGRKAAKDFFIKDLAQREARQAIARGIQTKFL